MATNVRRLVGAAPALGMVAAWLGMAGAGSDDARAFAEIMQRALGQFGEMPDLQLTADQAARLWSGDAAVCGAVLRTLAERGCLVRTRRDAFSRVG